MANINFSIFGIIDNSRRQNNHQQRWSDDESIPSSSACHGWVNDQKQQFIQSLDIFLKSLNRFILSNVFSVALSAEQYELL